MNRFKLYLTTIISMLTFAAFSVVSYAETASAAGSSGSILNDVTGFTASASMANSGVEYSIPQPIGGEEYLFLPAQGSLNSIVINCNKGVILSLKKGNTVETITPGVAVDLSKFLSKPASDGSSELIVEANISGVTSEYKIHVMKSQNIASMYINTKDPVNKGLYYIANNKTFKTSGTMAMTDANGAIIYNGGVSNVKTRGNSTWIAVKKPFQIKLDKKTDLCNTGNPLNADKTWILLANAFDPTLLHNTVAFDMARGLGLNTPDSKAVDLFFDHKYIGSYLLTEKIETSKGRVDIDKKGYLLELDLAYFNQEEEYIMDADATPFVVKSPGKLPSDRKKYITDYMNSVLNATKNGGVDPATGANISDLVDLESLAKLYVLEETVKNPDAFVSSTYLYLPEGGKLTAGPVWDFDSSFGIRSDIGMNTTSGRACHEGWIDNFLKLPEFKKLVKKYESDVYSLAASEANSKINGYVNNISASQKMDAVCYRDFKVGIYDEKPTYSQNISYFKTFLKNRNSWAKSNLGK